MTVSIEIPDPTVIPTVQVAIGGVALDLRDPDVTPTIVVDWGTGSTTVFPEDPLVDVQWGAAGVTVLPPPATVDLDICVGVQGAPGTPGDPGPPGPPGPAGGTVAYTFHQSLPSTQWTVTHNLGGFPIVTVVDSAGTVMVGGVQYVDVNTFILTFTAAFSGTAYYI